MIAPFRGGDVKRRRGDLCDRGHWHSGFSG
jgi:hypothetical protein